MASLTPSSLVVQVTVAILVGVIGIAWTRRRRVLQRGTSEALLVSVAPPPRAKAFVVGATDELPPTVATSGVAAAAPETTMQVFERAVARHGDALALTWEDPAAPAGSPRREWSWSAFRADTAQAARALVALGVPAFGSVSIVGFNSPHWLIANMAAIEVGAKAVGIYSTNNAEACHYIAAHSEATVIVVEDQGQLSKFLGLRSTLPKARAIVVYNGLFDAAAANAAGKFVYSWAEFLALGDAKHTAAVTARAAAQRPGHCCTLIYTSGTTGAPKAVMCSHDNIVMSCKQMLTMFTPLGLAPQSIISYLPLSHVAAQLLDLHLPMLLSADYAGCSVHFARPDALKGSLGDTLKLVHPTIFFGVPRVWEKFAEKMKAAGAGAKGLKKALVTWAKATGLAQFRSAQVRGDGLSAPMHGVAKALVFSKVRVALGLDRCVLACTSAAPIAIETLEFFGALDIPILEGYGMSECTGVETLCCPDYFQTGSVGIPASGVELKIDHDPSRDKAGEGELCFRGRHVMMGYMGNAEKTKEAIDPQGWLHSGDVGRQDAKTGLVSITGRIKELIITAGGENVAPVPIEDKLKAELPAISNAMMVGDKRKYNVVLITLRCKVLDDGSFSSALEGTALAVSPGVTTLQQASKDGTWAKYLADGVKRANAAAVSNAAKIQKFVLVPEFSVGGGELTPTLKLKRTVVAHMYNTLIESLYEGGGD